MSTKSKDKPDITNFDIPESLRKILIPEGDDPEKLIIVDKPQGYCSIHGRVGWARMVLYDHDPTAFVPPTIVSEHCVYCLSRVFTAMVGKLQYDKDPEDPKPKPPESSK